MKEFDILVDTTADLDENLQKEYNIRCMNAHLIENGVDGPSFVKWETITRDQFYANLKANPERYKTSPPSVGEMAQCFEAIVSEGKDLLYVTISTGLSGTYNFALQAKQIVLEKLPQANIQVLDTLRFGPAIGLIALNASLLRGQGKTLDEVMAIMDNQKKCYHQAGWLDDLSYVAKQGRMTHAKAFLGTLIGIKPLGEFDYNGLTTVVGKAKGEKAALAALAKYVEATIENPQEQVIFVAQTNRPKQAEKYAQLLRETLNPKAVYVKDVYPSCGANIGPGLMAAYYYGKEISKDLSEEKELVNKFLEA